jgi:hypothetical protein
MKFFKLYSTRTEIIEKFSDSPSIIAKANVSMFKKIGKQSSFVDYKRIRISGGRGGDGCISFDKRYSSTNRPPAGGNGGRGGDVYIEAFKNISSLYAVKDFYSVKHGGNGKKNGHGLNAQDIIIKVPIGTVVRQIVEEKIEDPELDNNDPHMDLNDDDPRMNLILNHFKFKEGYEPQEGIFNFN